MHFPFGFLQPCSAVDSASHAPNHRHDAITGQVKCALEVAGSAIVRVRQFSRIGNADERQKQGNLIPLIGRGPGQQGAQIDVVHHQQMVKTREIGRADLTRAMTAQVVAVALGDRDRTRIGALANVIILGAG